MITLCLYISTYFLLFLILIFHPPTCWPAPFFPFILYPYPPIFNILPSFCLFSFPSVQKRNVWMSFLNMLLFIWNYSLDSGRQPHLPKKRSVILCILVTEAQVPVWIIEMRKMCYIIKERAWQFICWPSAEGGNRLCSSDFMKFKWWRGEWFCVSVSAVCCRAAVCLEQTGGPADSLRKVGMFS